MERVPLWSGSRITLSPLVAELLVLVLSGLGVPLILLALSQLF